MRYLPKFDIERGEMLRALRVDSLEDLLAHLPEEVRLRRPLHISLPGKRGY